MKEHGQLTYDPNKNELSMICDDDTYVFNMHYEISCVICKGTYPSSDFTSDPSICNYCLMSMQNTKPSGNKNSHLVAIIKNSQRYRNLGELV